MMKSFKKKKEIRRTRPQSEGCEMRGQLSRGEGGDIHQKILKKVGIDQEGDLEGRTEKGGKIETKMNITGVETEGQIRGETGVMKKRSLTKECKDTMREIVDKGEIMMTGNLKTIEDVIVIEIEAMMTEENMKTEMIMIEELIVTEEKGMTLKEIEIGDHLGEEMVKKKDMKEDTVLMTEEAEDLLIEVEVKGKIGNKMTIMEKVKVDEVEDLGVQQKTEIGMIQRKQDHQEVSGNTTMMSLHPHRTCKQNHLPWVPPTVTVNYEGGVGGGDRLRS